MKKEVIQDFLTVPGIAGVALIDGLSRPYFHGFGANFDVSQQDTIAQDIQQVLETTPEGFNSFEFQFDFYRIYLHKLKRGITLLVLTGNTLPQSVYTQAVRRLLLELQLDQENPIAAFQDIATSISLIRQSASQPSELSSEPTLAQLPSQPNTASEVNGLEIPASGSDPTVRPFARPLAEPPAISNPSPSTEPPSPHGNQPTLRAVPSSQPVSLKDVLAAMNALSQLTNHYLGTLVVANYWKVTRPDADWLHHFQIERSTQMTFSVQNPSQPLPVLTPEQHRWLQEWVAAFIERCTKVIRDFAKIVRQALTEQQRAVLFRPPQ